MKKPLQISCLLAVILLSLYAAAVDSDSYTSTTKADYTTRLEATINITYAGPTANYTLRAGEWFNISANIFCNVSYCGIVTIYPLYCKGAGCDKFTSLDTESYADIYTKNETPRRCLGVDKGKKCSFLWRIKAVKTGRYNLMFAATSEQAKPVYSGFMSVLVRGCGDGICNESENETYQNCPEDCCEKDCTGVYDKTCHTRCSGYNNCSFVAGCDARLNTYRECVTPTVYIRCCSVDETRCDYGTYCSDAACFNCSLKCDGECLSSACFGLDPDCDRGGNPTMPCCGNYRLDSGEECEWGVSGTSCDRRCLPNCTCAPDVTSPRWTTTTIVITTTQTTRNPWVRNPNVSDTEIPSSTLPVLNGTESSTFFPGIDIMSLLLIPLAFILLAAIVYAYRSYAQWSARKNYELMKNRENTLKKLVEAVSGDYTSQRITADQAGKNIFQYEKELALVRDKMEKALLKLKK
jgi:hypothetical protein